MTTLLAHPPALVLDERHDQIVAALTRRLARAARPTPPPPAAPHDFLVPVLNPELLEGILPRRPQDPPP